MAHRNRWFSQLETSIYNGFSINKFREYDCKRKISVNECAASRLFCPSFILLRYAGQQCLMCFLYSFRMFPMQGFESDLDGKIRRFEVIKHDKTLDFFTFFFDVNQVALCLNLQNTSKYAALRRWAAFKWHRWDFCRRLLMFFWVSWKGCNQQIRIIAYVIWYYIKIIGTLGFQSNYSGFWSFVLSRNVKFVFFLHQWLPNRWRESIFISISTCQKLVYWRRKGFARSLIPFYMQWTMQDSNLVWCWTYKQHQTSAHAFQRSKQLIPKYPK